MRRAPLLVALIAAPCAAKTVELTVQAGQQVTYRWSAVSPAGAVLVGQPYASPAVSAISWDTRDGKVLRFVCQGILPR